MQVGDLVRFKNNGMIGLVVRVMTFEHGNDMYRVSWADGHVGNRHAAKLELISESR